MIPDTFRFYATYLVVFCKIAVTDLLHRAQAFKHRLSYRETPDARNVVVIGGSFTGMYLAKRLSNSLPTGYKVVLIERNSHFNYLFNFPRFSVLPGYEQKAFIPYDDIFKKVPAGIFQREHDYAAQVKPGEVTLRSGKIVPYEFLAIATGTLRPPPANLVATEKMAGSLELRSSQDQIMAAKNIGVIGGGAVGVQIAGDIKSVYPQKNVALIHSRDKLLPNFKKVLHDYVLATMTRMGVEIFLNERPTLPSSGMIAGLTSLVFKDGSTRTFDLIIPCTGKSPPATILSALSPKVTSQASGRIIVKPTLQIADEANQNVFALGDVAETAGARMARAGLSQAEIVRSNIVSMIKRGTSPNIYKPDPLEGALKLTLGKYDWVMYAEDKSGRVFLHPGKSKSEDCDIDDGWKMLGVEPEKMMN